MNAMLSEITRALPYLDRRVRDEVIVFEGERRSRLLSDLEHCIQDGQSVDKLIEQWILD